MPSISTRKIDDPPVSDGETFRDQHKVCLNAGKELPTRALPTSANSPWPKGHSSGCGSGRETCRIEFVDVAEEKRCDLIIMGSKKRKGILSRLFGDHIVEKVIDRAPSPVYVVGV